MLVAWSRWGGYALGPEDGDPIAWVSEPDPGTWEGTALAADLELHIAPVDRRGSQFAMWQRDWRAADYWRRRSLGGGDLEADGAPDLRVLPRRLWRRRWLVKAGRAGWADVLSRPHGEPRLRFTWVDGADRSGLAVVCVCFAILVDELVNAQMPYSATTGGGGG